MKSFLRYTSFVIAAVGVLLLMALYPYLNSAFSVPFPIKENEFISSSFLDEGIPVNANLSMIMDSFATETIGGKLREPIFGTNKYEYNIVPVFVDDKTYYVGIKLSEEQFAKAASVIENTDKYHYGEEVAFEQFFDVEGIFISMDEELYGYMKEWFVEMGWLSEEEIGQYVLPLVIEPVDANMVESATYMAVALVVAGIICFVITFFFDIKYRKRAKVLRKCTGIIESELRGKPISIPVKELDDVDKAMWKGNKEKARKILIKSYKATEEEADDIVNRWILLTSPEEIKE